MTVLADATAKTAMIAESRTASVVVTIHQMIWTQRNRWTGSDI